MGFNPLKDKKFFGSASFSVSAPHSALRWVMIIAGVTGILFGYYFGTKFPRMLLAPALYFPVVGLPVVFGLLSFISYRVRMHLKDYAFVSFILIYLLLIFLAFHNGLGNYFVSILVAAQVLLNISFRKIPEFFLVAVSSMGLYAIMAFSFGNLQIHPNVFLSIMGVATLASGLFVWMANQPREDDEEMPDSIDTDWMEPEAGEEDKPEMKRLTSALISEENLNEADFPDQSEPPVPVSSNIYEDIFRSSQEGIILLNPQTFAITRKNQVANTLFPDFQKDMEETPVFGYCHPDDRMYFQHALQEALEGNVPNFECRILKDDGTIVPVSVSLKLAMVSQDFRIICMMHENRSGFKSEQDFRDLVRIMDEVGHGLIIFRAENLHHADGIKILNANSTAANIFRLRAKGLAGNHITDVLPGLSEMGIPEALLKVIRHRTPQENEAWTFGSDKNIQDTWRGRLFPLAGDTAVMIFSPKSDQSYTTSRLKIFRELIHQSGDAIFILNAETGDLIEFDSQGIPSPVEDYGTPARMLSQSGIRMKFSSIKPEMIHQAKSTGSAIFVDRLSRKNGTSFPAEINLGYVKLGEEAYLVGVARDISERIHQQDALRQSEQKYRTLVERMNEGLILTDNDETILFVNQRLCEILSVSHDDLIGRNSFDIFQGEGTRQIIEEKSRIRREGVSDQYEMRIVRHDGENIWLLIAGTPYVDSNGDMIGTIAIITDITDRKVTEIKLQEKNNELDAFVYKASHDLRGPLASIIGVTNIAREEVPNQTAHRYFNLITTSAERLDRILSELLDLTRINKVKINPEPLSVEQTLDEVFKSLEYFAQSRKVALIKDVRVQGEFLTDKKLFTSILQNLIVNGINYSNPDQEFPMVRVSVWERNNRTQFEVTDNGVGIPVKIKPRVFEMFYRGNTKSKGSGLGLYLVKTSVEKLEGNIDVASEEGVGTTFSFYLPSVNQVVSPVVANEAVG